MVLSSSYYTRAAGNALIRADQEIYRSDSVDCVQFSISDDNGATWTPTEKIQTTRPEGTGTRQIAYRSGVADPTTDRFIQIYNSAYWPNDDPQDGLKRWLPNYRVSEDGGKSWIIDEPIIQSGAEYDAGHPMAGVWEGRNCCMQGDLASVPLCLPSGEILVPVQISPVGADGYYHKPTHGRTFTDTAVLFGKWNASGKMDWDLSPRISGDAKKSTRGLIEPTLGALSDNRLLMVMRGSNDGRPDLPGRRWFSISPDSGRTWPAAQPWSYDDGDSFFSPSSCSQLLQHSSGKLFWLGNINQENPDGNQPRYPFVIGEVDQVTGLLQRKTISAVDDRQDNEHERLTLSNFTAHEDRESHDIRLHLTRAFAKSQGDKLNWTADASVYHISID